LPRSSQRPDGLLIQPHQPRGDDGSTFWTDGIGRALAETYLRRGYEVLIVGTNAHKPLLDQPPARLTAVLEGRRVRTDTKGFDPRDAARLHTITEELLAKLR
jgi:NAD(P)-dependent dehydrogenase (short-subunit alcohol dehydrogenase family)